MNEAVTIILPLPSGLLSPNRPSMGRGGRMRRHIEARSYRMIARAAALGASIDSGPWELASITAAFFHKQKRRRDDVNHLAMLKPAYDGLVDAELLADDDSEHLKTLTPSFHIDKEFPRVELTVVRLR